MINFFRLPSGLPRRAVLNACCALTSLAIARWPTASAQAAQQNSNDLGLSQGGEEPSLPRIVTLATKRAPEALIGKAELEASRSSYVGARLWPVQNPYLEVVASRGFGGFGQRTIMTGTVWLPIEVSGQRGRRIEEAESFVGMHAADLERVRARVRAAAVRNWGRAIVEVVRIRTLTELAASAEAEAKAFQVRRNVGDATERDAQLSKVEHARQGVLVEEARTALVGAMGELMRLTGRRWNAPNVAQVHPPVDIDRLQPSAAAARSPFVQAPRVEADYYAKANQRLARDSTAPVSVILSGGRGEFGETLLGAGLAWTFPTFRRFQGERARAQAEQQRALFQSSVVRQEIDVRLETIAKEMKATQRALEVLENEALPAAQAARQAAESMFNSGKIDILALLVSRRDEALLRLRRLDLAEQEWSLVADWTELTGEVL